MSLHPAAVLKKQQTSDVNKQEHMANCSVTFACASSKTVLFVAALLKLPLAFAAFCVSY